MGQQQQQQLANQKIDNSIVKTSSTNNNANSTNTNSISISNEVVSNANSAPIINNTQKPVSRTQELLFFNNNNFGKTTKQQSLLPKVEVEREQKILKLINHDWQKDDTSLETKLLHVQAGLQKMSTYSDVNENGEFVLQFFKRNS